jgi:hypothetical protein
MIARQVMESRGAPTQTEMATKYGEISQFGRIACGMPGDPLTPQPREQYQPAGKGVTIEVKISRVFLSLAILLLLGSIFCFVCYLLRPPGNFRAGAASLFEEISVCFFYPSVLFFCGMDGSVGGSRALVQGAAKVAKMIKHRFVHRAQRYLANLAECRAITSLPWSSGSHNVSRTNPHYPPSR